ncbi:MAG: protein phosphatase 2C domain-containing protein [Candidatus Zhuqueibacterota bacterium]
MKNATATFPNLMTSQVIRQNRYITQKVGPTGWRDVTAAQEIGQGRFRILETLAPVGDLSAFRVAGNGSDRSCGNCGKKSSADSALFCTSCGFDLRDNAFLLLAGARSDADPFELLVSSRLRHSGLPVFIERFSGDDVWYVLGRDIAGERLSDVHREVDPATLREWLAQLSATMAYLHSQFIFNVGLQPQDIFIASGRPLVLNFTRAVAGNGQDTQLNVSDMKNFAETFLHFLATMTASRSPVQSLRGLLARVSKGNIASFDVFQRELADLTEPFDGEPATAVTAQPDCATVSVGLASDTGVVRSLNEDSLAVFGHTSIIQSVARPLGFYIVADGMGGHEAGEEASRIAVQHITREIRGGLPGDGQLASADIRRILENAVFAANETIYASAKIQNNGMGTTITLALLYRNRAYILNVGDGRAYLVRGNRLQLITQDHSLVYRLYKIGQLPYHEIWTHPQSNQILCALGESRLKQNLSNLEKQANHPYFFQVDMQKGDGLLLCTDGLWQMIRESDIAKKLALFPQPQLAVDELVRTANENGGVDNISLIYMTTQ